MPSQDFPESDSDDFKLGAEILIDAGYDQQKETIFKGAVIGVGVQR